MNFGNYAPLAIDMKKLCTETLREIDSGKKIEDALSEASKKLYADNAQGALMAVNLTLIRLKHTEGGTKLENVKKLAQGGGFGFRKDTPISNVDEATEDMLNEIPEDFRKEFEKIRELMKNQEAKNAIIEFRKNPLLNLKMPKNASGESNSNAVQRKVIRCSKCDCMNPNESNKCINCSAELKKSFFSKLVG